MIAFRIEMLLKRAVPMLLAGMLVLPMTQASTSPDTGARLAALADRYFENRLRLFSLSATEDVGDPRFEGELQIEIAPAHRQAQAALFNATLSELQSIAPQSLTSAERATRDLLQYDARSHFDCRRALFDCRHCLVCVHARGARGWF